MFRLLFCAALLVTAGSPARSAADETPNAKAVRELVQKTGERASVYALDDVLEVLLGPETTDAHLKALADLAPPKLWKVNLGTTPSRGDDGKERTKFTKTGLKELARLPALRDLRAPDTWTDDDLKEIAGCQKLEVLFLTFSKVTDAGLAHLAAAPKLRELHLNRTAVTDAGWEPLSKIRTLEKIAACERVTGTGVGKLADLPKLTELDLRGSRLTEAGLKELAGLTALKSLQLGGTKVPAAGLDALAKALPKCRIER